jgi:arsenate reductase (thioredoxin)
VQTPYLDALPLDQQHLVRQAAVHLEREFEGTFGRETVERFIADSLEQLVPTATVTPSCRCSLNGSPAND